MATKLKDGEVTLQYIRSEDWYRAIQLETLKQMCEGTADRTVMPKSREFPIYCSSQIDYVVIEDDEDSWRDLAEQLDVPYGKEKS